MRTGPHTALRVRERDGKEDTFEEETTATLTKHVVKRRVYTQSKLEARKVAEFEEDADVKGLCHFAAIVPKGGNARLPPSAAVVPKDGNARPSPVHKVAPPLYMSKARVDVCSREIPSSNVPPTGAVTSLQLHCYFPMLLDGFDFAPQFFLVCFPLPGQKVQLYVAELTAYTDRCLTRVAARQKAAAAR